MAVSSQRRPAGRLFFRRCAGCVHALWERPWPHRGRRCPQASIQAAVGVRRPLPQNPARAPAAGLDHAPVGAALAVTRPLLPADLDPGRRRGQDPSHRTPARLSPRVWLTPCGSGLGRDTAAVVRRLRSRSLSGSRPLPQNLARAPAAGLAHAPVGAALAATRPRAPRASMQAAVGVRTPPTKPHSGSGRASGACPCGSSLGCDTAPRSAGLDAGRCRGQDPSHRTPLGLRPQVWRMPLWEQPWLRHGRRAPHEAAVRAGRPLPQTPAPR